MFDIVKKAWRSLCEEGFIGFFRRTHNYIRRLLPIQETGEVYRDVLFINGCWPNLPHPVRYRVSHQREQLEACNISTNEVLYLNLTTDMLRHYRTFVFFRCPYTDIIGDFIEKAKALHKTILFDIDDLVIDTKYTDTIPFVIQMDPEDKKNYDGNVDNYGRLLRLCNGVITTTEGMASELAHYVPNVFINRNAASEEMVKLSEAAIYERDILPYLSKNTVNSKEKKRYDSALKRHQERQTHGPSIGYFSGSITHNPDFEMILPSVLRLMEEFSTLELHVVGLLELPKELLPYNNRIFTKPFVDWQMLPALISSVDINIAPLTEGIFNEAKSENKWIEASLVKTPTVASNIGAFKQMIRHNETGFLCDSQEDWYFTLRKLIVDKTLRQLIALQAYKYCVKHCTTIYGAFHIANYIIRSRRPNFMMVLPSLNVSGGVLVALKHSEILSKNGYDVTLLVEKLTDKWYGFDKNSLPILSFKDTMFMGRIDNSIATVWFTMDFQNIYNNIENRYYLVQNFETDFYRAGDILRLQANATYLPKQKTQFVTISKWCQNWLEKDFQINHVRFAPNGILTDRFYSTQRDFSKKIRILIEGDSASHYKNVDESFEITNGLNPEKYEVWYMSYNAEPKATYRVDKFLHKIPYEEVANVYAQCHILVKSSILESFSYPPLEMMATGGYVVVSPNGGNAEYLIDEKNCLLYPQGNITRAREAIERIVNDEMLRMVLYKGGQETSSTRDWTSIEPKIISLYQPPYQ